MSELKKQSPQHLTSYEARLQLWEILVPTISNEGKPYRTRYHRVWDKKVREISGGLTIFRPAKGQWVNSKGKLFEERMIPVRIACTEDDIDSIINLTMKYYNQEAVMSYQISEHVKIVNNKDYKLAEK